MSTILITGAASGLGAAFVEAYAAQQPSTKIIALDRTAIAPNPNRPNVQPYTLDLTDEKADLDFAESISTQPISLIIHSAGIRGLVPALEDQYPNDVAACETLAGMDTETMMRTFQINTVATFSLIRALLPNLLLCHNNNNNNNNKESQPPKVIIMSSRMGSLTNNAHPNPSAGSAYAYRASKAALNVVVRSFAVDVPVVVFVLCHPGRVETGLVRGREEGAIEAAESVGGILRLIEGWGKDSSGEFYDRFGERIEW